MKISVIIPTYNPNIPRLLRTINGLKRQSFPANDWELIIVDNNSNIDFSHDIDLAWKIDSQIIRESRQGLTYARLRGFNKAKGEIVIMVDDDNILEPDYLKHCFAIFQHHLNLGAIGGKSLPSFDEQHTEWLNSFYSSLALRDLGEQSVIEQWGNKYPEYAPIGAGMAIRKKALDSYIHKITSATIVISDRNGKSLSSGGDNDIVLEILKSGYETGYFPELCLQHIIPKERTTVKYLARLSKDSNKSWVKLLESHEINPWARIPCWTVPIRKIKAWLVYRAWRNSSNYINWKGACGTFEGLSI